MLRRWSRSGVDVGDGVRTNKESESRRVEARRRMRGVRSDANLVIDCSVEREEEVLECSFAKGKVVLVEKVFEFLNVAAGINVLEVVIENVFGALADSNGEDLSVVFGRNCISKEIL